MLGGYRMASENLIRKRMTEEMPPDALEKHIVEFLNTLPKNVKPIRVDALKVELTDISLKSKGYAARQVLVKRN
jgi:hypothetical protein